MAWHPDAIRDPGLNANYRRGRTTNRMDVAHETVGRDSRALIRDRGLAQFLVPKRGRFYQFAPDDAVCSHACEWNILGSGIEVERFPGEPMTADQIHNVGSILHWRHSRGIPLAHWSKSSGRLPIGSSFRGTADHGGLTHRACDQHTDGWPGNEYSNALNAGDDMPLDKKDILSVAGAVQTALKPWFDELKKSPPGSGASKAEVQAIVDAAIAKALAPFQSLLPGK